MQSKHSPDALTFKQGSFDWLFVWLFDVWLFEVVLDVWLFEDCPEELEEEHVPLESVYPPQQLRQLLLSSTDLQFWFYMTHWPPIRISPGQQLVHLLFTSTVSQFGFWRTQLPPTIMSPGQQLSQPPFASTVAQFPEPDPEPEPEPEPDPEPEPEPDPVTQVLLDTSEPAQQVRQFPKSSQVLQASGMMVQIPVLALT